MTTNTTTPTDSADIAKPPDAADTTSRRVYDVPADAPSYDCPYCDAALPEEDLLDLHIGVEHEDEATEAELEAFEETFERESNQVFIYHLKVISLVVGIYFIFLFTYSAIL